MKKSISILVLLALAAGGAFALDLSAGGGLLFDLSGNNGLEGGGSYMGSRTTSFGGFVFFDATYAELDVYFAYGSVTAVAEHDGDSGTADGGSMMQLGFSLLGKYPINMGSITLFPLVGITYNRVLSVEDPDGNSFDDAGDLSQFGFLLGAGLDFSFTDALFLRAEALFNLRLPSTLMSDAADAAGGGVDATLGMGPRIKVGVGYKF